MHDVTRRRAMKQALASSCGTACDVHRFRIPALCTSTHATRTAQQTAYLAACTPYRSNRSRKNSVEDTRRARCYLRRKRQREREMRIQGEITPRAEPPHSSQSVYRLDWPKIMTWWSQQLRGWRVEFINTRITSYGHTLGFETIVGLCVSLHVISAV